MMFPKNNHKLREIFKKAKMPEISEFSGEYFVDMLTILPNLRKFSHRKFFYKQKDKVLGYNILFTNKVWGHFFLEEGICKEIDSSGVIVINYNRGENGCISNRIIDYVKCIEENSLYLGRFNYLLLGKLRFSGYFSLSKII